MQALKTAEKPIVIAAFYHFAHWPDFAEAKEPLMEFCNAHGLKGTILLAHEGINSTISGSREGIDALLNHLKSDAKFVGLEWKESYADYQPFEKMKVRLKKEIVRMGLEELDISDRGHYVTAGEWDALIAEPDVLVVDTRNIYETKIGTFKGALDPKTHNFRDFPAWAAQHLDPQKHKKIAMFCTGGIRCEKSTAYLKTLGFEDVYHLKGGILQYLEDTGNKSGAWQGECFVFDDRVAVNADLEPTHGIYCRSCGNELITDEVKYAPDDDLICRACNTHT